jgi:ABC-type nitrate/sulfonate/bicarbonate transport system permease component
MGTREKWLLSMLTGIFIIKAAVFVYGMNYCVKSTPEQTITDVCPNIGDRFETSFSTMIATTLALLTGSALGSTVSPKKPTTTSKPKAKPKYVPPKPGRQ